MMVGDISSAKAILCFVALVLVAGCIQSNEFVPVTPSDVVYSVSRDDCFVVIEGVAYNSNSDICEKIILNRTNWVKFCPEIVDFPLCQVKESGGS